MFRYRHIKFHRHEISVVAHPYDMFWLVTSVQGCAEVMFFLVTAKKHLVIDVPC